VQVLLTIGLLAILAMWAMATIRRLDKMRSEVKLVWEKLEADRSSEAIRNVNNKHVEGYNAALESFPANIIGPLAGFKPARRFHF
jgi:hypothetical protein